MVFNHCISLLCAVCLYILHLSCCSSVCISSNYSIDIAIPQLHAPITAKMSLNGFLASLRWEVLYICRQ